MLLKSHVMGRFRFFQSTAEDRKERVSIIAVELTESIMEHCRQFFGEGIEIPTPSQQGIHKALFKRAAEVKQHLVSTFLREKWSLHFHGKRIQGIENQDVVLKKEANEIELIVVQLKDGTAAIIAKGI